MNFDADKIASIIKTEAIQRLKDGLHPNLANSLYEVYGEIGQKIIKMMVEANEFERNLSSLN